MEREKGFGKGTGFRAEGTIPLRPIGDPIILPNGRVIMPGERGINRASGPVSGTSARQHRNSGQRRGR